MTSSQVSNADFQHQSSKTGPFPTKKSLYADMNRDEGENQGAPQSQSHEDLQQEEQLMFEPTPGKKQSPVCCNYCNMF